MESISFLGGGGKHKKETWQKKIDLLKQENNGKLTPSQNKKLQHYETKYSESLALEESSRQEAAAVSVKKEVTVSKDGDVKVVTRQSVAKQKSNSPPPAATTTATTPTKEPHKNTNTYVVSNSGKEYTFTFKDINLFFEQSKGKQNNDKNNKVREEILTNILDISDEQFETASSSLSKKWIHLKTSWKETLTNIAEKSFDTINVKKLGGRNYNYDFRIQYFKSGEKIQETNAEFKFNASSLKDLPQILSLTQQSAKNILPTSYAEYYYKYYLDQFIGNNESLKALKPKESEYLKYVSDVKYSQKFFEKLINRQKTAPSVERTKIVHESIKQYLDMYRNTVNLEELSRKLQETQGNKTFLLWSPKSKQFFVEKIDKDDLKIKTVVGVKNNNSIIVESKSEKIRYSILIRWANTLGVANPTLTIKYIKR
jgi:hypothetical protein